MADFIIEFLCGLLEGALESLSDGVGVGSKRKKR